MGLCLNPPEHAIVLRVDEKSQIQARDRTQPGLSAKEEPLRDHDARLQAQRDLTTNRRRRGALRSVEELINAIGDHIDQHNVQPKPFTWTAKASDILEKVKRARRTLANPGLLPRLLDAL